MKAIIVDDEFSGRNGLKILLDLHCPGVVVVAMCDSVSQAINDIETHAPDLVFLDIEMPFQSGFDLLKALPSITFEVIFVTAYNKYAIQAIKFNALDYLLKPIQPDELVSAVKRVKEKQLTNYNKRLEQYLLQQQGALNKIAIPLRDGFLFVDVQEIVRCEADSNYSNLFLKNGERIISSRTLSCFEEMLTEAPNHFIRVHHAHLINPKYIKAYTKGEGGTLTLTDDSIIPVSRRKKDSLFAALKIQ